MWPSTEEPRLVHSVPHDGVVEHCASDPYSTGSAHLKKKVTVADKKPHTTSQFEVVSVKDVEVNPRSIHIASPTLAKASIGHLPGRVGGTGKGSINFKGKAGADSP